MIADFGLSRVMEEEKFQMLTEICGTPGVSHTVTELPYAGKPDRALSTWHPKYSRKVGASLQPSVRTPFDILITAGHGKPVDVWAMGVITYFLLCGELDFFHNPSD